MRVIGFITQPALIDRTSTTSADTTRSLARLRPRPSLWPPPLEIRPARRTQAMKSETCRPDALGARFGRLVHPERSSRGATRGGARSKCLLVVHGESCPFFIPVARTWRSRSSRVATEMTAEIRRRGLDEQLLRFALGLALAMTEDYGCVGVAVDAKPGAEGFYAGYGFRAIEVVEGLSDARPRPKPLFLPTSEILAATARRSRR
jgi:hypothetical protein